MIEGKESRRQDKNAPLFINIAYTHKYLSFIYIYKKKIYMPTYIKATHTHTSLHSNTLFYSFSSLSRVLIFLPFPSINSKSNHLRSRANLTCKGWFSFRCEFPYFPIYFFLVWWEKQVVGEGFKGNNLGFLHAWWFSKSFEISIHFSPYFSDSSSRCDCLCKCLILSCKFSATKNVKAEWVWEETK